MSNIFLILLFFTIGLVLIIKGGDIFVDAATWIAEVSGIPKFIIGATVVSLATTLPELLVSVLASLGGSNEMAIGNAVGSVTANLGLILGVSVVCMPSIINRNKFSFKGILMLVSCAVLYFFSSNGALKISGSIVMLAIFIAFVFENIFEAKKSMNGSEEEKFPFNKSDCGKNIIKFALGATGIVLGADLLVDNGKALAEIIGIPESIIGVTIIAIGTSLPEFVTTITAIAKKQASLSIGNIIGANIIDLTLILPVCSFVSKGSLPVENQALVLDFPACLILGLVSIVPTVIAGKFKRSQGIVMLSLYAVYVMILCFTMNML